MSSSRPYACPLKIFGLSVQDVLDNRELAFQARDLDCAELWSGVGSVHQAAQDSGWASAPFDKARVNGPGAPAEDILTQTGFLNAVRIVLRLRAGGLLWMAPVCSSFLFLNLKNTQRRRASGYMGNSAYLPVKEGNAMARTAAFLMALAKARAVEAVLENPACSLMFKYTPVRRALKAMKVHYAVATRCSFATEPLGQRVKKPYKFAATGSWISQLRAPCTCPGGRHTRLAVTKLSRDGRKTHITGNRKALRDSAAYPPPLGKAIVQAWEGAFHSQRSTVHSRGPKRPWTQLALDDCQQQPTVTSQREARAWTVLPLAAEAQHPNQKRRSSWMTPSLQ